MAVAPTYARAFLAARSPPSANPTAATELGLLEAALASVVTSAQSAWPSFQVPVDRFLAHLAARVPASELQLADQLQQLHTGDLYLVVGCLLQLPAAFVAFETAHFRQIESIVRSVAPSAVQADDIQQLVREKLFLATGEQAALAKYSGQGALQVWLRVVVTRLVLNVASRGPKERVAVEEDLALLDRVDAKEGLELAHMRSLYDREVREALPVAFAALSVRERLLLRQRYLDDLSLEQLSALHDVHLATIKRQLAATRESLNRALRDLLMQRLEVSAAELTSILRLVDSHFHITVRRLLDDAGR